MTYFFRFVELRIPHISEANVIDTLADTSATGLSAPALILELNPGINLKNPNIEVKAGYDPNSGGAGIRKICVSPKSYGTEILPVLSEDPAFVYVYIAHVAGSWEQGPWVTIGLGALSQDKNSLVHYI
jgi:hypothetical protein